MNQLIINLGSIDINGKQCKPMGTNAKVKGGQCESTRIDGVDGDQLWSMMINEHTLDIDLG